MAFDFVNGAIVPIDKPIDWTSFDVVKKVKNLIKKNKQIKKIKVGHAGTLDPVATGLLLLCTGKATKQISALQDAAKTYIATLELGKTTPSFDKETAVDHLYSTDHITLEQINKELPKFVGTLLQVPPAFSAKHYGGKRAYQYARQGEKVDLEPVNVWVESIQIFSFNNNLLQLQVTCGKGTYIRSLARDIGIALNSGAYLYDLRRTHIGSYSVDESYTIDQFEELLQQESTKDRS